MKRQLRVNVNNDVIGFSDRCARRDGATCIIANAVKFAVADAIHVNVDLQTVRYSLRTDHKRYVFLTPRAAQECLVKWDRGQTIEPFAFVLRNPQIVDRVAFDPGDKERLHEWEKLHKYRRRAEVQMRVGKHRVTIHGGAPPPVDAKFSKRRVYGLKALRV